MSGFVWNVIHIQVVINYNMPKREAKAKRMSQKSSQMLDLLGLGN